MGSLNGVILAMCAVVTAVACVGLIEDRQPETDIFASGDGDSSSKHSDDVGPDISDAFPPVDATSFLTDVDVEWATDGLVEVAGFEALRVDELAEQLRSEEDLPGVAMMAFNAHAIVARGVAGLRKYDGTEPITDADKFHLGSCTKAMTATLVARLVEQDVVRFDSTMGESFPDLKVHAHLQEVTIAQLLRHEGGVYGDVIEQAPELWAYLWEAGAEDIIETRRSFAESVLMAAPAHPVGSYKYSNTGYIIVGAVIEAKMGVSWEDAMAMELFEPLGMGGCGFGAPGTPGVEDAPWGHRKKSGITQAFSPGPAGDNPPALGPAGTVHCDLDSWANFLMAHLGGGPDGYLAEDTWGQLHTPGASSQYALGWSVPTSKQLKHFGSNTKNVAGTWLYQSHGMGYAIVTNMGPANVVKGPLQDALPALIEAVASLSADD